MTIRDVQADFGFQPRTASTAEIPTVSIVGSLGTYISPNSYDTGPYGAYLTEFSPNDTLLTAGGQTFFVESGAGQGLKLVVDWVVAPVGSGTIQSQLITAPAFTLPSPTVMIDFDALPISLFVAGYRQIMPLPRSQLWQRFIGLQIITTATITQGSFVSWLGLDVDSELMGYAEGYSIK